MFQSSLATHPAMDYHYHQEGWGPLQEPFNTFPLYSSLRATGSSEIEEIQYGDFVIVEAERNQLLSQPFAYPTSSIHPSIDTDNTYQPRYLPNENLIPQTPVQSYIPALPPSISPRDIHIPRYNGLEVTIPESTFQPDSQQSPLVINTKYDDGLAMEADTDTDSESDSDYGFGPVREVSRNLLNDLASTTSSISQVSSSSQIDNRNDQPDVIPEQQTQVTAPTAEVEKASTFTPTIVPPALVNPPLIINRKKSPVSKGKRQSAINKKKEDMVKQTPGDKKTTSGRQVLLAKKAKPGRRPIPIKAVRKKAHTTKQERKGRSKSSASSSTPTERTGRSTPPISHDPSEPRSDDGLDHYTDKGNTLSAPKLFPAMSSLNSCTQPKSTSKLNLKPKIKSNSISVPKQPKKATTRTEGPSRTKQVQLKKLISSGEEDYFSPNPPSPDSVGVASDPEDDNYCPPPSPVADETEDESPSDNPRPSLSTKKRSRVLNDDDEEWGVDKKVRNRKVERAKVIQDVEDGAPENRKMNKARNQLYHPGRQEQNVRAQSKYRNKIKARSDLILEFAQEIFPKVRNTPSAKKLLAKLRDLDHAFAIEKFGQV
ncbi:hypothetical protein V865_001814 [Kwoniella europaea PYCC6329]|uniref:BHLH domain-containing protein n=1 Tax=Kwoniella europaea PYCC6329 TaxID=1423913 RepID=A0AAX4KEE9_9TREE